MKKYIMILIILLVIFIPNVRASEIPANDEIYSNKLENQIVSSNMTIIDKVSYAKNTAYNILAASNLESAKYEEIKNPKTVDNNTSYAYILVILGLLGFGYSTKKAWE